MKIDFSETPEKWVTVVQPTTNNSIGIRHNCIYSICSVEFILSLYYFWIPMFSKSFQALIVFKFRLSKQQFELDLCI